MTDNDRKKIGDSIKMFDATSCDIYSMEKFKSILAIGPPDAMVSIRVDTDVTNACFTLPCSELATAFLPLLEKRIIEAEKQMETI